MIQRIHLAAMNSVKSVTPPYSADIMCQYGAMSHVIHVLHIDFDVEHGFAAGAWGDAGDLDRVASGGLQAGAGG